MRRITLLLVVSLSACDTGAFVTADDWVPTNPSLRDSAQTFQQVSRAVGAAARAECRRQTKGQNCNFGILIELDPFAEPNAFQTLDENGRPFIIFTQSMIKSTQNADEMAFVMGHEAAHHILGHIARQVKNAEEGARIFGELAEARGEDAAGIEKAQELGAEVGIQSYTKDFELEADQMGTQITYSAGYNPLVGMAYFNRIPDPGDRFLASHPPHAKRIEVVLNTAGQLGLTQ
ncbi:MAG: M48 family metallopeptidase [Ruegeria sp.]